ncbi:hypothetical protein J2X69_002585 [Algoriphagus sp. 4150]|uniref:hypothetical protein n=1 Tax=Algoriphagus sp. 4150 TaxID=2817756 RepID=UPI002854F70E|nr:hypothetical protein [Algoriphagus sp. 4150]MDR7130237.1 hypothetical protein [Algoriphagus sp. 4150]
MKNGRTLLKPTIIVALALVFAFSIDGYAQTEAEIFTAKNALYVEFGGNSGRYAINYSRIIHQKEKLKLNVSAGFSMWSDKIDLPPLTKTKWLPVVPLEFSAFWGKSNHHLEMGTGITSYLGRSLAIDSETFEFSDKVVFGAFIPLRVGYRYQKSEGGFFFRIGYTPIINIPVRAGKSWSFDPYFAGISFGKSF